MHHTTLHYITFRYPTLHRLHYAMLHTSFTWDSMINWTCNTISFCIPEKIFCAIQLLVLIYAIRSIRYWDYWVDHGIFFPRSSYEIFTAAQDFCEANPMAGGWYNPIPHAAQRIRAGVPGVILVSGEVDRLKLNELSCEVDKVKQFF